MHVPLSDDMIKYQRIEYSSTAPVSISPHPFVGVLVSSTPFVHNNNGGAVCTSLSSLVGQPLHSWSKGAGLRD